MASVTNEELLARVEGRTVCSEFLGTLERHGGAVALRSMDPDGSWTEWTFERYASEVASVATGLQGLGVGKGDRVVLMMRNRPEFHVADLAVLFLGATPISIYNSSSADQVAYLAGHCDAKVAIVEDPGFLERFTAVADQLPALKHKVVIADTDGLADITTWRELLDAEPIDLRAAVANSTPDDLATVIYTSGTTGSPKGVMLSHRNICWTVESLVESFEFEETVGKRLVSYLPMAHVAERMVSHYCGAFLGFDIATCPEPGRIADYARAVHPNIIFGVPRVWEKVYAGVNAALAADPEKERQVNEAVAAAIPISEAMVDETITQEQRETYDFLDAVAFSTIRQLVGLDEVELAVTGAAPIPPELIQWFRAIGVPLSEVYGMSENCGPMCFSPWKPKIGTVGPACPGVEVRIAEDGEVICRGGLVFEGYLNDPEKTAETVDEDGWLHSGDIGEMDQDGYVTIIDRKKELIITAGGKNVSPANLEAALKMIPLVGQAAAVGDNRPFVAALVVLDPEVAPAWAAQHGLGDKTLAELAEEPLVVEEIERGLAEVMASFNNAERVKKVTIIGEEWLPDSELLTPTSKLKRRGVASRYADEIEALYS
jgi:long-chain acyl-CoA synthetase